MKDDAIQLAPPHSAHHLTATIIFLPRLSNSPLTFCRYRVRNSPKSLYYAS